MCKIIFQLLLFSMPLNAYAYIGPGMGVGLIGAVFGVCFSIFLGFIAILWYPFKRLLKKIKADKKTVLAKDDSK